MQTTDKYDRNRSEDGEFVAELNREFFDEYNKDLDGSEAEIDAGNSFTQNEVKKILVDRRK